jgi:hypothetical protein
MYVSSKGARDIVNDDDDESESERNETAQLLKEQLFEMIYKSMSNII